MIHPLVPERWPSGCKFRDLPNELLTAHDGCRVKLLVSSVTCRLHLWSILSLYYHSPTTKLHTPFFLYYPPIHPLRYQQACTGIE